MNPVAIFEEALAKTSLTPGQIAEVRVLSDALWAASWEHHCLHLKKHLEAIAPVSQIPGDPVLVEGAEVIAVEDSVTTLSSVVDRMLMEGMAPIAEIRG
jgi:hypothetical protein